jgi:hypothetical protein
MSAVFSRALRGAILQDTCRYNLQRHLLVTQRFYASEKKVFQRTKVSIDRLFVICWEEI